MLRLAKQEKDAFQSCKIAKITVTGRKSGKNITLPVQFVYEDNKILLLPFMGKSTSWYANLKKNPSIIISINKTRIQGKATLSTDPAALKSTVEKFRTKYGASNIASYYPKKDASVEVAL